MLSIPFPSWLKPEIIEGLPIRWYGLMYLVAFGIAFFLYRRQVHERSFPMSEDDLNGLFFWSILSLLLGARIFATLIYETSTIYREQPWLVIWPFRNGQFTGLQGMSYHGGVAGGILATIIYSYIKRFDYREIGDMFCASIPLGYTFGRLGNFINGELYGRITASPLGMVFPLGGISPQAANYNSIREGAINMGLEVPPVGEYLNLPRYPSQLFEAFFEGIVLWALIWVLRNRKPFKGFLVGLYLAGYGLIRFFIEYFREPDEGLGYRIQLIPDNLPPAISHPLLSFSTGQILCVVMILSGILWWVISAHLPNASPHEQTAPVPANKSSIKNKERKQRQQLQKKKSTPKKK
ncbi:prolipoprotein diacylglyceryl transferase [Breznakiellaceae bacterium SP9]